MLSCLALKKERCLYLLSDQKRRKKFTGKLSHFKWVDERFAKPIPSNTAHTAAEITALLRSKGAGDRVWVISQRSAIDGQETRIERCSRNDFGARIGEPFCPVSLESSHTLMKKKAPSS